MNRDPRTNPFIGDIWENKTFKWEIINVDSKSVVYRYLKVPTYSNYHYKVGDEIRIQRVYIDLWNVNWFVANSKEKENMTITNTDRERAITNPQPGDRWVWPDNFSLEIYEIANPYPGEIDNRICFRSNERSQNSVRVKEWAAYVHPAKFVGNFAQKSPERDPLKDPKAGDKWQTTIMYHNATLIPVVEYNEISPNQVLMITEVQTFNNDVWVRGYFANGKKFNCNLTTFPARMQSLKFLG